MIDNGSSLDVASVSYDSFGNPTYNESQVGTFRNFYAGREYDDFTGLYYNRARWYDPQATRFISQDPISFAGGDTNLYRYAGNSPDNATDPSGNIIPLIVWAGFAVAGVGAGVTNYYANEADIATGGNCYIPGLTEDRGAIRQIDQERYQDAMAGVGAGLAITGLGASLIAAPALGAALGSGSTLLAADGAIFSGLYGSTNAYAQGADGWGIATAGATHAAFGAVLGPTLGFAGRVASPYIGRAGAYAGEQLLVGASRVAPKTTQSLALSSTLYVNAYRYGLNSSAGAYAAAQGRFFLRPSVTMQSARTGLLRESLDLQVRASELQTLRNVPRGTTAVVRAWNPDTNQFRIFVATEQFRKPSQLDLRPGEIFVEGIGHAEEKIMKYLRQPYPLFDDVSSRWVAIEGGTSRNVCKAVCQPIIEGQGLNLGGPHFGGRVDKTPFRAFY